jgi:glycosyltransferase involved in cell wall biosynthesis
MITKLGAKDGLCIHARIVLKSLLDRGHDVHVFTQAKEVDFLPPDRVHKFPAIQLNPHFSLDSISAPKMIARECARYEIDVLHVQMNSGSTEFLLPLFKEALPPLVVTYHLAYSTEQSSMKVLFDIAGKASLFTSGKYDGIVLVHPFQKKMFLNKGVPEEKLHVIVNGVDTNHFTPRNYEKTSDIMDFIYVGRLSYDKGIHILLEAFSKYHKENQRTRLTLLGNGMLKSMIKDFDDNGSIRWFGDIEHDLIPRFLQEADAFVVPMSIGPLTSSMSVLEAMSCGLPLITTNVADADKLLRPDEGILVPLNDVQSVVDAMRTMTENPQMTRSMGDACRKKVVQEHSWDRQIELHEKVYTTVMGKSVR